MSKTNKPIKVYAVNRPWRADSDIFFTTKPIGSGAYKQKILFTINIPKGTPFMSVGTEMLFTYGGGNNVLQFPVNTNIRDALQGNK